MHNNRLISIVLSVFVLASVMSTSVVYANVEATQIFTSDFSNLDLSGAVGSTKSFGTNTGGIFGEGFDDEDNNHKARVYINNPDDSTTNETEFPGTGTITKPVDEKYGTTVAFHKSKAFVRTGFGLGVRPMIDKDKNFVIKTAIKRTELEGCDIYITMSGYPQSGGAAEIKYGFDMVRLKQNGDIYVNCSKDDGFDVSGNLVGKYEAGIWYEFTIEYTAKNKFAIVTIDGGAFDNAKFYSNTMTGNQADWASVMMMNHKNTASADVHIAYFNAYYTNAKSIDDFSVDTTLNFDRYKLGTLKSNAFSSGKGYYTLPGGFKHYYGSTVETDTMVVSSDANYGKSLKMADYGAIWNQLRFPLEAPYAKPFTSGKNILEFSIYGGTDMAVFISTAHIKEGNETNYYNKEIKFGNENGQLAKHKWLRAVCTYDMDDKLFTLVIYDPVNPSDCYNDTIDISDFGDITQVGVGTGRGNKTGDASYVDNIHVYSEKSNFEISNSTPFDKSTDNPLFGDIVLNFTREIESGSDGITISGGGLTSEDYTVSLMPCKRTVIIRPKNMLGALTDYSVNISNLKYGNGAVFNKIEAVKFKTADYITVGNPVFTNSDGKTIQRLESGNITASIKVTINDKSTYPFAVIYALYNKADNSIAGIKAFSADNAPKEPMELTLTVPESGQYYAEVSVLDTYIGLRPYVKKFRLE